MIHKASLHIALLTIVFIVYSYKFFFTSFINSINLFFFIFILQYTVVPCLTINFIDEQFVRQILNKICFNVQA